MCYIRISNESFFDKDYYSTFASQSKYKFFSISSGFSTLVPFYQELLREAIGSKVDKTFKDFPLIKKETIQKIQTIFKKQLEVILPKREPVPRGAPVNRVITWEGDKYLLYLSLTQPISRQIVDYYRIIEICKECLSEDKPMFLSMEIIKYDS